MANRHGFYYFNLEVNGDTFMNNEGLLTVQELAKELKVNDSWVYGQTRKTGTGSIPRVRVGKYIRFRLQEVLAWLQENSRERG
jgi:excisionase family DNA binding protein